MTRAATKLTQRRIKARKASACGLCKPWKQGWADKKTVRDIRHAPRTQQQLAESLNSFCADALPRRKLQTRGDSVKKVKAKKERLKPAKKIASETGLFAKLEMLTGVTSRAV